MAGLNPSFAFLQHDVTLQT